MCPEKLALLGEMCAEKLAPLGEMCAEKLAILGEMCAEKLALLGEMCAERVTLRIFDRRSVATQLTRFRTLRVGTRGTMSVRTGLLSYDRVIPGRGFGLREWRQHFSVGVHQWQHST